MFLIIATLPIVFCSNCKIHRKAVVPALVRLSVERSNLNHNEYETTKAVKWGDTSKEALDWRQMHAFEYFFLSPSHFLSFLLRNLNTNLISS